MKKKYTFKNISTKQSKMVLVIAGLLFALFVFLLLVAPAEAHGNHDHDTTINNYYESDPDVTNISNVSGISDSDLTEIIGSSLAGGSHQFDFSTTKLQLSVTGATSTSDWDEDSEFSFAIGKRFGKDSKIPNALWHVGYTPDIVGDDYIHGGATFVID